MIRQQKDHSLTMHQTINTMTACQTLSNSIASNYRYDAETGLLQNIQSANALYNRVQDLHYEWDTIGNFSIGVTGSHYTNSEAPTRYMMTVLRPTGTPGTYKIWTAFPT